jgi:nucleotide-binding universal stress UspA family protein
MRDGAREGEMVERLRIAADVLAEKKADYDEARRARDRLIRRARAEGMSLRAIGVPLDMSHSEVDKVLARKDL